MCKLVPDVFYIISSLLFNNNNLKLTCKDVYEQCMYDNNDKIWLHKIDNFIKLHTADRYSSFTENYWHIINPNRSDKKKHKKKHKNNYKSIYNWITYEQLYKDSPVKYRINWKKKAKYTIDMSTGKVERKPYKETNDYRKGNQDKDQNVRLIEYDMYSIISQLESIGLVQHSLGRLHITNNIPTFNNINGSQVTLPLSTDYFNDNPHVLYKLNTPDPIHMIYNCSSYKYYFAMNFDDEDDYGISSADMALRLMLLNLYRGRAFSGYDG